MIKILHVKNISVLEVCIVLSHKICKMYIFIILGTLSSRAFQLAWNFGKYNCICRETNQTLSKMNKNLSKCIQNIQFTCKIYEKTWNSLKTIKNLDFSSKFYNLPRITFYARLKNIQNYMFLESSRRELSESSRIF